MTDSSLDKKQKMREYYQNNKEAYRARARMGYYINSEKIIAREKKRVAGFTEEQKLHRKQKQKEWREKNRDRLLEEKRKDHLKNKKQRNERNKEYYRANPNNWHTPRARFTHARAAAKKRSIDFTMSYDDFLILVDHGCHYCGGDLPKAGSGLDRKDSDIGYNKDNCVPCCHRCNITFNKLYSYEEKLILAETIKKIDQLRDNKIQ